MCLSNIKIVCIWTHSTQNNVQSYAFVALKYAMHQPFLLTDSSAHHHSRFLRLCITFFFFIFFMCFSTHLLMSSDNARMGKNINISTRTVEKQWRFRCFLYCVFLCSVYQKARTRWTREEKKRYIFWNDDWVLQCTQCIHPYILVYMLSSYFIGVLLELRYEN